MGAVMSPAYAPEPKTLVSVVIPTMAVASRAAALRHAIASIHGQRSDEIEVEIIVVVNGARADEELVLELAHDDRVRLERIEIGSAPGARLHGLTKVRGEFFAFLDDDDEFLPGAFAARVAPLHDDPTAAFSISDGYATSGERVWDSLDAATIAREPLATLVRQNWVASCGPLFRTGAVPASAFAHLPHTVEWTILAFELFAARYRFRLVEAPTFRLNDTPASLSKCDDFPVATVEAVRRMLRHSASGPLREELRDKLANALHLVAEDEMRHGRRWRAWGWHVRCLVEGRGFRYLSFTRHLFRATFGLGPCAE